MSKYVYFFGSGKAEGRADMKELLGGKGANLAEMTNIGLPVPAGFTITTEVCNYYYDHKNTYPPELKAEVDEAMRKTEQTMGAKFGDAKNPLLVSCRSGARASMPGMMDTVLNIGLNEATLKGLIDKTGNERFAWDSYRRFVQMYGDVVLDLKPQSKTEIDPFEKIMEELKHEKGVKLDTDLSVKDVQATLEKHYRDMQDIEFTVQKGKLWMLQTRNGKRTGFAAVRIAVDMVDEGLITKEEALSAGRIPPDDLNQLLQPIFDPNAKRKAKVIAKGINAGPGAATGVIKFFADDAEAWVAKYGKPDDHGRRDPKGRVILVRSEASPEDIRGMQAADGILTAFGGASSHAALVSRQMGKVCIVGCGALQIDYRKRTVTVGSTVLKEGDFISIDGFTGEVMAGQVATKPSEVMQVLIDKTLKPEQSKTYQKFARLMEEADKRRKLKIRTNADKPDQATQAIAFGAEGIGLCRTEHMFFDHIKEMREMILAETPEDRKKALAKLLPFQRADFEGLFKAMKGFPVTIRTLDPPLHEFLPHDAKGQEEVAKDIGVSKQVVEDRVKALHEFNPMLGLRGCRLGIVYPEITE